MESAKLPFSTRPVLQWGSGVGGQTPRGVLVTVAVVVADPVGVCVGVTVAVWVGVPVAVSVAVEVGVWVGDSVAVSVEVGVSVGV